MREEEVVSVIVPVYNVEKYLERCVESIIRQTYDKLQIILVNDASKDRSGEICDILAQRDSRIRVFHKNWGGLADTRNVGLAFATGEYISFVDSDDYVQDTMLEKMVNAMKKCGCDIAVCGRYDIFEKNMKIRNKKSYCMKKEGVYEGDNVLKEYFGGTNIEQSSCCDKLFHYSVIEGLYFPVGKTSEDLYFTYNAFKNAKKVIHVAKPFYYYCHRSNSITTKLPVDKTEMDVIDFLKVIEKELWIDRKFITLKDFYSFYTLIFIVIYDEIKKSSKVDKSFKKYVFRLKIELLKRLMFVMCSDCVSCTRKKIFIKKLLDFKI